jgi:GT2 family glycosyltransferase
MSNASAVPGPQVTASIVTHNNERCLPELLDSLRSQQGVRWEARFFDNASRDRTCAVIRECGAGDLHVNGANVGYSRGHNHNAARARGTYLALLNPDIRFGPDLFRLLVAHLDHHQDTAAVGPHVLEGPDARPFPPRRFYPGEGMVPLFPEMRRRDIAWLNGCCIMFRLDVFERLGGFDPDFFLYQSETDLCLRARLAGYRLGLAADAVVHHQHRQSQRDMSDYGHARLIFEGSAVFWQKHFQPDEVASMVRFQHSATRTLLAISTLAGGLPARTRALSRDRLRARHDVCAGWLQAHATSAVDRRFPIRIALRQGRLALEWIRQRRFPLDDY